MHFIVAGNAEMERSMNEGSKWLNDDSMLSRENLKLLLLLRWSIATGVDAFRPTDNG